MNRPCGCPEEGPLVEGWCVHQWAVACHWWKRHQVEAMDVRHLVVLADKYLPDAPAADLHLASTTPAFFLRLRALLEETAEPSSPEERQMSTPQERPAVTEALGMPEVWETGDCRHPHGNTKHLTCGGWIWFSHNTAVCGPLSAHCERCGARWQRHVGWEEEL